jgi:hypothetical protein
MAVVTVATSSTTLLAANKYRQITLSNRGTSVVWCEFATTAVVGSGFPLDAGDKIVIVTHNDIDDLVLSAIAVGSSSDVSSYGN